MSFSEVVLFISACYIGCTISVTILTTDACGQNVISDQ